MVGLSVVREVNAGLVRRQFTVAVFVGGTAGIGEFGVRGLAKTHGESGKGLRVYIMGRNKQAAERIIAESQQLCPQAHFIFVAAKDLALLRDVDQVCEKLVTRERDEAARAGQVARVDFLVMTQGVLNLSRKDTEEGIDETMSLFYYSRMRFIVQLLPLLVESPLPAHVASILAPGNEGKFVAEDISCRKPENFGMRITTSHICYMTTFFMEQLATRHPGKLSLSHVYPGAVITQFGQTGSSPTWLKLLLRFVVIPLMRFYSLSEDESGQRTLFLASEKYPARGTAQKVSPNGFDEIGIAVATDGVVGGGCYRINQDGETFPTPDSYQTLREQGVGDLIWQHTSSAFEEITSGRAFTG
ncbi:hypothetical protein BKA67DRAFT_652288 [Truncatella angustata]|uniref:Uncharacterized protein n=1 Tax=Truncatella angustata TaxID=152316 RepID=A0A9P8UVC7_9PEZI|nr:uncharacterized protein BKA67DRAFT_652288 [Truncatella angustata]KAH6659020.1 hypothetical protein BKA67DRAFT_652288 [Truncatella angustata]